MRGRRPRIRRPSKATLRLPPRTGVLALRCGGKRWVAGGGEARPLLCLSPRGRRLDQNRVATLAKGEGAVLLAGRGDTYRFLRRPEEALADFEHALARDHTASLRS